MTNCSESLRLHSLWFKKIEIAFNCECTRNTVSATLLHAVNCGLKWPMLEGVLDNQLSEYLFPAKGALWARFRTNLPSSTSITPAIRLRPTPPCT